MRRLEKSSGRGDVNMVQQNTKDSTERSSLPHDLIIEIFSRLPAKAILRFRSVCKAINNDTHSPAFIVAWEGHQDQFRRRIAEAEEIVNGDVRSTRRRGRKSRPSPSPEVTFFDPSALKPLK